MRIMDIGENIEDIKLPEHGRGVRFQQLSDFEQSHLMASNRAFDFIIALLNELGENYRQYRMSITDIGD